jgi:hypothetical protein
MGKVDREMGVSEGTCNVGKLNSSCITLGLGTCMGGVLPFPNSYRRKHFSIDRKSQGKWIIYVCYETRRHYEIVKRRLTFVHLKALQI